MRVVAGRRRGACLLAVVVAVVAAACTSNSSAPVDPRPLPTYEFTPNGLCTQAAVNAIGAQLGLVNMTHTGGQPYKNSERWKTDCVIGALWEDERFLTGLGPGGPTSGFAIEVYADVERAKRRYEVIRDRRQELVPQSPMTEIDGWWDEGWRIQWYERVDGASIGREELDAMMVFVNSGVRHHNLVILVDGRGIVPGHMQDEGYEVLSDLEDLLIEATRRHVTLSTSA